MLSIPRGAVDVLRNALSKDGEPLSFNDNRVLMKLVVYRSSGDLRDYQTDAVDALVKRVQGYVVMPCGSGKTRVGIAAISRIGQPAVILVHTRDLLDRWIDTIRDALGLKAGVIAEGKTQVEDITVGMIQTLVTMASTKIASLGRCFGTIVLDEAYHTPANVFRSVLSQFAGKYRFGLTATPERADGLSALLEPCIGPDVFEIDHTKLVVLPLKAKRRPTLRRLSRQTLSDPYRNVKAIARKSPPSEQPRVIGMIPPKLVLTEKIRVSFVQ